jgi:DNA polymerase-3 subunit delta
MDAQLFLDRVAKSKRQPVYVLSGDEDFLKRRCRDAIIALAVGDADPAFAVSVYPGEKLDFSTVRNDLNTLPFLAPARVVVVEQADPFVTEHRSALERYVQEPSKAGVLVLDVKSFPETTRLAKALPDTSKIRCEAPKQRLADWCIGWARSRHNKKLTTDAAHLLVDRVGPHLGLLDQELDKLATAVGTAPAITAEDVGRLVGRSREADVFRIMNAVGEGKPGAALAILAELLEEGENELKILGALTFQLRTLAAIGRSLGQGRSLAAAMDAAGVPNWPQKRQEIDRQVRHLGRGRLAQLTDWLVEVNLGLKGGSPLPPRLQLERLIVKLARPHQQAG